LSLKPVVNVVQFFAAAAALAFVVLLFVNDPDKPDAAAGNGQPGADGQIDGAAVFSENCARCHGADGGGGAGAKLSDGLVVANFPDVEDQIAVVTNGRGPMPPFGDALSADAIRAVVEYTRTL
jgi:mono/diheme cytochrome c family protein